MNADAVVAIEAEMTLSEDSGAKAVWTLTDGVLDGYDDLSLAASSSLEYTVSIHNTDNTELTFTGLTSRLGRA